MAGAPSTKTPQLLAEICERLAAGESLRTICDDDGMPEQKTVFRWIHNDPAFGQQYARARCIQMEAMAEEIMEISDDARNDWMEKHGRDDAGWVANGEHVQRSRLRVDTRKWLMSKLAPKKYGDVIRHEGNEEAPIPVRVDYREKLGQQIRGFIESSASAIETGSDADPTLFGAGQSATNEARVREGARQNNRLPTKQVTVRADRLEGYSGNDNQPLEP